MWRTKGMRLINHSPKLRTEVPNHDDMNTPTKKINVMDVINPSPGKQIHTFIFKL